MAKENDEDFCTYVSVKIDDQVLPRAKAAAALTKRSIQDFLSDVANEAASKVLKEKTVPPRRPIKKGK